MTGLIAFRALQGLGGGGLIVLAMAIVGDVVAPRERGRYQGYFGGVFAVASVVGPLAGGLFVDHLSWRWVFYVNLPIGVAALVAVAMTLPAGPSAPATSSTTSARSCSRSRSAAWCWSRRGAAPCTRGPRPRSSCWP